MQKFIVFWLMFSGVSLTSQAQVQIDENLVGRVPFLTSTAQNHGLTKHPITPFISSALSPPDRSIYDGPVFQLRHDYPDSLPPATPFPWKEVTDDGLITQQNSKAYVEALKAYVSSDMRKLLFDYSSWDPQTEPWWQSIWLGVEREPIHGLYVGSGFPAGTLTDQTLALTTYVHTLYDARAAVTLNKIWGTTEAQAYAPNLNNPDAQYAEGSVIVKFAFVTSCGDDWAPMTGAASWPMYFTLNGSNGSGNSPQSGCPNNGSNGTSTTPALAEIYLM